MLLLLVDGVAKESFGQENGRLWVSLLLVRALPGVDRASVIAFAEGLPAILAQDVGALRGGVFFCFRFST